MFKVVSLIKGPSEAHGQPGLLLLKDCGTFFLIPFSVVKSPFQRFAIGALHFSPWMRGMLVAPNFWG